MLIHERQAQQTKIRNAIDLADEHYDALTSMKMLERDCQSLIEAARLRLDEGSPRLRQKTAALATDLAAFAQRFADLRAAAQHDLNNAEQAVVMLRAGAAA